MISFFLALGLVLLIGGAITTNAVRQPRQRSRKSRASRASRFSPRQLIVPRLAWAGRQLGRGYQWARAAGERQAERARRYHTNLKAAGLTAATRAATPPLAARPGAPPPSGPESTAESTAAPSTTTAESTAAPSTPSTTTTGGTVSTTTSTTTGTNPMASLFEMTDAMLSITFGHVSYVDQWLKALRDGTHRVATLYSRLAERMEGPMSIDPKVVEPVRQCAAHQRGVYNAVSGAANAMGSMMNATPLTLLESGQAIPRAALLNNYGGSMGAALIPSFYESAATLANRPMQDIRQMRVFLLALSEASDAQHTLYLRARTRLIDARLPGADDLVAAGRNQQAITARLAEAEVALGRLLNMTIRQLAEAGVRAPEIDLTGK